MVDTSLTYFSSPTSFFSAINCEKKKIFKSKINYISNIEDSESLPVIASTP